MMKSDILEKLIDQCQEDLEPLKSFILQGGGRVGALSPPCRTVCRRADASPAAIARRRNQPARHQVHQSPQRSFLRLVALDCQANRPCGISLATRADGERQKVKSKETGSGSVSVRHNWTMRKNVRFARNDNDITCPISNEVRFSPSGTTPSATVCASR